MSKSVKYETIAFDKEEVMILWGQFLENIKKYAREHYVRNGSMNEVEADERVEAFDPFLELTVQKDGVFVSDIIVEVEINQDKL